MRTHTNDFKNTINTFGKEIKGKLICYNSYNLISETNDNILSEGNLQTITEQANYNDPIELNTEDIFEINIIKNGNLLQSLMKELDFETKDELNIGSIINPQFGLKISNYEQTSDLTYQNNKNYYILDNDLYILLIKGIDYSVGDNITGTKYNLNETYEYLDYGNYIIYSKEFNLDTETWNYVCYDKMLFSMIKYMPLKNVTFPITIKQYINLLCNKIGLEFEDSNFTNYNELIYEDVFKDRNMTYRDIFDEISKITSGNLLIGDNDKLKVGYVNSTNDTIDENYLSEVNVALGKKVGPINSVAILNTEGNLEYVEEDTNLIKQNGLYRITITDNLLTFNGNTQIIAENILNKLKGLYYYIIDVKTIGVCYYDFLDMFNIQFKNTNYQCLLLNNEINITQGLEEQIYNEELEEVETNSNNYVTPIMSDKEVQFRINQQEGQIQSRVEKDGVISAINQSAEEIQINANKITLEGYTTINDGFSVDENGNMSCNNANATNLSINGGRINLTANSSNDQRFVLKYDDINNSWNFKNAISPKGMIVYNRDNNDYYAYYESNGFNTEISGGYSLSCYPTSITLLKNNVSNIILDNNDGRITCVSLTQTSSADRKKDFEKLTNAKEILKNTDIYKYNLDFEEKNDKKSIGVVIGKDFNYSKEITSNNNDGINLYSMVSVLWQVVKEQQEEIDELKEMIKNGKY